MEVLFTNPAKIDFAGILDSVAGDNPAASRRLGRAIVERFKLLGRQPFVGERCHELGGGLRRTIVGSYVAYYRVNDRAVEVVRILHGARDHRPLLDEE